MEEINSIQGEVDAWSLSSDMKLLNILRNYSAALNEKTTTLVNKIEELNSDVCITQVKLRNTFNEFMMMSNTQFIENVCRTIL